MVSQSLNGFPKYGFSIKKWIQLNGFSIIKWFPKIWLLNQKMESYIFFQKMENYIFSKNLVSWFLNSYKGSNL